MQGVVDPHLQQDDHRGPFVEPDAPRRPAPLAMPWLRVVLVAVGMTGSIFATVFAWDGSSSNPRSAFESHGGNGVASKGRFNGTVADLRGDAVLIRGADDQERWLRTTPGEARTLLERHADANEPVQVYWVDYADDDPWGWLVGIDGPRGTLLPEGATAPAASDPNQPPR